MRGSTVCAYLAVSVVGACAMRPWMANETPPPAPSAAEADALESATEVLAAEAPALELAPESAMEVLATGEAQTALVPDELAGAKAPPAATATGEAAQTVAEQREALKKTLLLLPFRNATKYKGPWDIHIQLPRGLADSLRGAPYIRTIPVDSGFVRLNEEELAGKILLTRALALGRELQADVVVVGEVLELTMKRSRAVVRIGGYRSYEAALEVELHFYNVIDGTSMGEYLGTGGSNSKRTGVTNPAAYLPLDKEYALLGLAPALWGSQEFAESLVGQAVALCLHDLKIGVTESAVPPPELIAHEPKIIDITDAQAYINVGLANGVRNGDKYGVWNHGRQLSDPDTGIVLGFSLPARVGVVQIERGRNDRLSFVRVLEGQQEIEVGFSIRAE